MIKSLLAYVRDHEALFTERQKLTNSLKSACGKQTDSPSVCGIDGDRAGCVGVLVSCQQLSPGQGHDNDMLTSPTTMPSPSPLVISTETAPALIHKHHSYHEYHQSSSQTYKADVTAKKEHILTPGMTMWGFLWSFVRVNQREVYYSLLEC